MDTTYKSPTKTCQEYFENCTALNSHCEFIMHSENIDNIDPKSIEDFNSIYSQCMANHNNFNVALMDEKIELFNLKDTDQILNEQGLIKKFLTQKYEYPQMHAFTLNKISRRHDKKTEIEPKDSYRHMLSQLNKENSFIFLTGNIGSGKSTYLKRLAIDLVKEEGERDYLPFYIDILDFMHHDILHDEEKIYDNILAKILNTLKTTKITEEESNASSLNDSVTLDSKLSFSLLWARLSAQGIVKSSNEHATKKVSSFEITDPLEIIKQIDIIATKQNKKIIIMLDNFDTFAYDNERYMFFEGIGFDHFESRIHIAKNVVHKLIHTFNKTNISIIFALRPYVKSHFFPISQQNQIISSIAEKTTIYEIIGDYSKEVLEKRGELLSEICTLIAKDSSIIKEKTKRENILKISKSYNQLFLEIFNKKENSTFSDFYNIVSQGYRTIINFYNALEFHPSLYKTYFTHHVIQLYKLSFHQSYCQVLPQECQDENDEHVHSGKLYSYPNMFLVVCAADCNSADICTNTNYFTYWLKYLVLLFINEKKEINLKEVIEIFSDYRKKTYQDHAVKLTIGSLGTVNEYNCIKYDFNSDNINNVDELIAKTKVSTSRLGANIINNKLSFSIYDLQFFTEDWLLPKPKSSIFDESFALEYRALYTIDYTYDYLLSDKGNFTKMMMNKAKRSILFLYFLEYSMMYEREKYSDVWEKIQKEVGSVHIFNNNFFEFKRLKLIETVINELFKGYPNKNLEQKREKLLTFKDRCETQKENIKEFFKSVYENDVEINCKNINTL